MIRMPLPWLVFSALFIFLAGILFTWICYEFARRKRERARLQAWTRCPVCAFQHKILRMQRLHPCPQCGALNEHQTIKIL